MDAYQQVKPTSVWKNYEIILFRFFFIYFLIQVVPLDWKYYQTLFAIDWGRLYYADLFNLSRYTPRFLPGSDTLANWLIVAIVAAIGTAIWSYRAKNKKALNYDNLYYWLRVILRYRLAWGVIAYGFIKIFPLQAPFPSISSLNTAYGDMTAWKIFSVSLGAAPIYQVFLGIVEVLAGLLLLYRKTASIGAFIIVAFTGNVWLTNLAYEGGEAVYSLYLTVIAAFLFAYDLPRLVSLLAYERYTQPNGFKPIFAEAWQKRVRWALKGSFIAFFVVIYAIRVYSGYLHNPHNVPQAAGLPNISGIYNVREFVINNDTIPYSTTDPVRWKDVVFEEWATISIRSNQPVQIDATNVEVVAQSDEERIYELAGSIGRHYYGYDIDEANQRITLVNKNKHHADDRLVLNYLRPDSNTVILAGIDGDNNTLNIVLDKLDKKYLFIEAQRQGRRGQNNL